MLSVFNPIVAAVAATVAAAAAAVAAVAAVAVAAVPPCAAHDLHKGGVLGALRCLLLSPLFKCVSFQGQVRLCCSAAAAEVGLSLSFCGVSRLPSLSIHQAARIQNKYSAAAAAASNCVAAAAVVDAPAAAPAAPLSAAAAAAVALSAAVSASGCQQQTAG